MNTTTLYRLANATRPRKGEALAALQNMIEAGEMNESDLAMVYASFLPAWAGKPSTDLRWVYRAVAKMDGRLALHQMYSTGKILVGTDGHRLHWIPTALPMGYYNAKSRLDLEYKFPEIETYLTPPDVPLKIIDLDSCEIVASEDRLIVVLDERYGVNLRYLEEAVSREDSRIVYYSQKDVTDALHLPLEHDRRAVIMPTRI